MFSTKKNFFKLLNLVNAYDASLYFGLFWETFIKFETSAGSLTNLKMSGVRKYQHKHKCKKMKNLCDLDVVLEEKVSSFARFGIHFKLAANNARRASILDCAFCNLSIRAF